ALRLTVRDAVEVVLHPGGEVVLHELGEVVLEQAHDREGDPVRNESGAARRHIAAIDDRRDDRGERRRATDAELLERLDEAGLGVANRKSTRLNSSHVKSSYAVFCLKKKKT